MTKRVDDVIRDLRNKAFQVDCAHIQLLRASDGKQFNGPGYIRQKSDQGFQVQIYSSDKYALRDALPQRGLKSVGKLFTSEDFFELAARDVYGPETWKASRIIDPQCGGTIGGEGHIVETYCHEIALHEDYCYTEECNSISMRSFDAVQFPRTGNTETTIKSANRDSVRTKFNIAEFESSGLKMCFEDNDGLSIFAKALGDSPLPTEIDELADGRVSEAIWFALGAIPRWAVRARATSGKTVTRFRNHNLHESQPFQRPPYKIELADPTGSVWRMFDLYLRYVLDDRSSPVHRLSQYVFSVCNTRGSSIQGHALAVAVAVESLLGSFYKKIGHPSSGYRTDVDSLLRHMEKWKGNAQLVQRAKGSVSHIKSARALDRLLVLADQGAINHADPSAWKDVRNSAAHGRSDGELQELLDNANAVEGLFNRLVFNLIGYHGKQTDYATRGWPTVDYPSIAVQPATSTPKHHVKPCRLQKTRARPHQRNRLISLSEQRRREGL